MKFKVFFTLSFYFLLMFLLSLSMSTAMDLPGDEEKTTRMPVRGQPKGEPKIKKGEKAPMAIPEMEEAHKNGKVIALMLGMPSHCPWCDRMDRYIRHVMETTKNFDNQAVFIMRQSEWAKLIPPDEEGVKLKEVLGVEGQPWLFLLDKEGLVRYIYKQFVSGDKFERSMYEILGEKRDVQVFDEPKKQ
ncbi:MAG: thioredoxin family protein [Nitrospinae bacterium]|nr:thioredoxin family protein [Nitrospinota bacterium]